MAKRRIYCDGAEMILFWDGRQHEETMSLKSNEIASIKFLKTTEKKFLFFNSESEKIEIKPSKLAYSITYSKSKAKEFFEQYKEELAKFAKDNNVTFHNTL